MGKYLQCLVDYYNEIVTEEMHWTRMHAVIEDGNMHCVSYNDVSDANEFVVVKFLMSLPEDVRYEIWERANQ